MSEFTKVKQIPPNHATHLSCFNDKFLNKMFTEDRVIAQAKYDGERMLIHIDKGNVYCTSRRISKQTGNYMENQDKLPVLKDILKKSLHLDYTVIDCECYSKDWSTIVGILHSLPERAIELQKNADVKFACFDCLFFDGQDLRDMPYKRRLTQYLIPFLEVLANEKLHYVKTYSPCYVTSRQMCEDFMNDAISDGFEGIVIKSLEKSYYDKGASIKCKKFETLDVVICGYQQGRGKYENTIGALNVGYYDEEQDKVIHISKVNCGSDEQREYFNSHQQECLNKVIEVKCQEITDKSLRHPVFLRVRDDKDYKMCTRETIFK